MPSYTRYPIGSDPETMLQDWLTELRVYWPNFDPSPSALSLRQAAALVQMLAESREVAGLIPDEIFRYIGRDLFNLPAIEATAARTDTTWVMRDAAGYPTIPAGTIVSIENNLFETTSDIEIPTGLSTFGPIGIVAIDEGAAASGLGAPGDTIALEEPYEYVASVTIINATTSGQDAEDQDVYMTRLRTRLSLLTSVAVTVNNLSTLAMTVNGVDRAVAIKGYNPDTDTFNNPATASVAMHGADGEVVPTPTKTEVSVLLLGPDRLANAELFIIDPTYTLVDVTWAGIAFANADVATVHAAGDGAVAALLDPTTWGAPQSGEEKLWQNKTVISLFDIAGALDNVEGLDRVTSITIGLAGGAQTSADHNLTGPAPLPRPGTIVGTVTAP